MPAADFFPLFIALLHSILRLAPGAPGIGLNYLPDIYLKNSPVRNCWLLAPEVHKNYSALLQVAPFASNSHRNQCRLSLENLNKNLLLYLSFRL
jgi:hypothetical protein